MSCSLRCETRRRSCWTALQASEWMSLSWIIAPTRYSVIAPHIGAAAGVWAASSSASNASLLSGWAK
jgi:hypothetical protein